MDEEAVLQPREMGVTLNNTTTIDVPSTYFQYKPFTFTTGFVAGVNTLDFSFHNLGAGASATGLRVDGFSGTAEMLSEVDQRGQARVVNVGNGLRPDIGAYESQGVPSWPVGDYNHNGIVDAADYIVWRNTLGQTGANLPANGDNTGLSANKVDAADFAF